MNIFYKYMNKLKKKHYNTFNYKLKNCSLNIYIYNDSNKGYLKICWAK